MIKANELRLFNWVLRDGYVSEIQALIGEDNLSLLDRERGINTYRNDGYLQPINLTAYWLNKMGFDRWPEEDGNGYSAYREPFGTVSVFLNDMGHCCAHYCGTAISQNHPQFVHQLQNLYFALAGEELTINN